MKLATFCLLTGTVLLAACGHKDDQPAPAAVPVVTQGNANATPDCSESVTKSYRMLNRSCRPPRDREAGSWCRGTAERLQRMPGDLNCNVKMRDTRDGEEHDHLVTDQELRELLMRLRAARF